MRVASSLPSITKRRPVEQWTDDELFRWLAADLRREDAQCALAQYALTPLTFGRVILPHHFRLPMPAPWHPALLALLMGVDTRVEESDPGVCSSLPVNPLTPLPALPVPQFPATQDQGLSVNSTRSQAPPIWLACHAPRTHAKSTLVSLLYPLLMLALDRKHFIILVSNTYNQAAKFLQAIRHEWETNQALRDLCPHLTPNKDKWTDSDIELLKRGQPYHKIVALGSGAQLRGLKFLQWRPDAIILDDAEDDEMVRSDLRRLTFQEWMDNVVLKVDPACDILMVGTILHELSFLNRVVRQKDSADQQRYGQFTRRLYTALDASGHSTWPERETTAQLLQQREANPYSFSQEKQGEPVDPQYCPFKSEFFTEHRFWTELPQDLSISITIDPAWTVRDHSKETALVCAGWDAQGHLWVLDDHHAKYEDPSLILDLILDWYLRWTKNEQVHSSQRFFCVGFDAISAQKMLLMSFKDRCAQRHLHPVLRELKADRDKIRRIWQLEPLFRQDRIFLRPDMTALQAQLQGFPRNTQGGLCDLADALAYHLQFAPYRPEQTEEPARVLTHGLPTMGQYAQLSRQLQGVSERCPGWMQGMDPRLVAAWVASSN